MDLIQLFESRLPTKHLRVFRSLDSPCRIQEYLDSIPYQAVELDRSPLRVMTDGQAHCLDGGIFGALALNRIGFPPLIMDLVPEPGRDDDHVLALFKINGRWGCLAKSNYAFLRFREAVYSSLRELAMTYFESFTNTIKEKTLRGYTRPLHLSQFDPSWLWDENGIAAVSRCLYSRKPTPLVSAEMTRNLSLADKRFYEANTLGTDLNWAYGIRKNP